MDTAGADERLNQIFEHHYNDVLAYCSRRIGRSDADDVVAEVFAVAWRRIDQIDSDTIRPWLFGTARWVLANRWRSLRRWDRLHRKMSALARTYADSPEVLIVRREEDREMLEALSRLKESDQEVLRLTAWEELTASEIAAVLNITVSAAEKRIQRALQRLTNVVESSPTTQLSLRAAEKKAES
jgi:RNA polymerase sigma-70 factor (ECF subfamily)